VNFGGAALTADGVTYEDPSKVPGLVPDRDAWVSTTALVPSPPVDAAKSSLLNSVLWKQQQSMLISQTLPNGTYAVSFAVFENFTSNFRKFDAVINSEVVEAGIGELPKGQWREYGPYTVSITSGKLDLQLKHSKGDTALSYLKIESITPDPPTLEIDSPTLITTTRPTFLLKGSALADAGIDHIEFKIGKRKFSPAKGTTEWSLKAKLKPGRNVLKIRAIDSRGTPSPIQKIIIFRE